MKGACDCHTHVFGPASRYPYTASRAYTPPDASVAELVALHDSLGIERVVIVHPSPYGTDNSVTLDATRQLGARARAVVVVDDSSDLAAMHRAGARGIRCNLFTAGVSDPAAALRSLQNASAKAEKMGWHVQVYTSIAVLRPLHKALLELPVPLVIDHFGLPEDNNYEAVLDLVKRGKAYVKISAPHRFRAEAAPLARALAQANPERLLWGSDWPHPGTTHARSPQEVQPFDAIDDRAALERLAQWLPDASLRRKVLVENPARLYDFPPA